ncbi:large ribosomal subunit protein bL19cz-like [Tasmannia lanceolata]|uniref:large ribosomal subunit protein bL19cz-like n=1 Tax=Tasmannia lanceolata TaxID=3420 RepID=UPI004063C96A
MASRKVLSSLFRSSSCLKAPKPSLLPSPSPVSLHSPADFQLITQYKSGIQTELFTAHDGMSFASSFCKSHGLELFRSGMVRPPFSIRHLSTTVDADEPVAQDVSASIPETAPRIKFKRPSKTAKHIMQILDKEAVEKVRAAREIPDIKPGYILQLKVEVPENKRRVSTIKGIVIARRNAGLNTTIRIRRLVAGVGVESVLPLYSPNIKEMKVVDKKQVRRAKLYYLRDRLNPLKK